MKSERVGLSVGLGDAIESAIGSREQAFFAEAQSAVRQLSVDPDGLADRNHGQVIRAPGP
jgi:hypothetical protein